MRTYPSSLFCETVQDVLYTYILRREKIFFPVDSGISLCYNAANLIVWIPFPGKESARHDDAPDFRPCQERCVYTLLLLRVPFLCCAEIRTVLFFRVVLSGRLAVFAGMSVCTL